MSRGLIFWVLVLLWGLAILGASLGSADQRFFFVTGGQVLNFILFVLLGWHVFGPAIKA